MSLIISCLLNTFQIILPPSSCSFTARLKLLDSASRILHLQAAVIVEKGSAVQINITAPYWIINKTGLPLVFRQEGVGIEAAGQFEEHEKARMVAPLLFSFSDEEASRTVSVRVGTEVHPHGIPQWSQYFYLQPGIHVSTFKNIKFLSNVYRVETTRRNGFLPCAR